MAYNPGDTHSVRHIEYYKLADADLAVHAAGTLCFSYADQTLRLHDGYTVGGRKFLMSPASGLVVNSPLIGNGIGVPLDINFNLLSPADITAINTALPFATSVAGGKVTLAIAAEYPSGSDSEAATPAYVAQAIAAIPALPIATDTIQGKTSLAVAANYPSGSDTEATTPAYVQQAVNAVVTPIATDTVLGKVSLAVQANYPSASDAEAATPAYVQAALAAFSIPNATDIIKGKVALAVAANHPQPLNDVDAVTPAYLEERINAIPSSPLATDTVPGISSLAVSGNYPSVSDSEAATPAYVQQAIANIPAVPLATDTLAGKVSLAVSGNYPSTSDSEATTPAYVAQAINNIPAVPLATDLIAGRVSLAVASNYPSGSDSEAVTPAYLASAIAALPGVPNATDTVFGKVTLAVAANYPSISDSEAVTPAYLANAISGIAVPVATDTVQGKVALAVSGNYPQPANDADAATPAYVHTAIAALPAIPAASDTVQGKVSLAVAANFPSVSDAEATTPAYVTAAIAAIPNKHVPATVTSSNNSIIFAASGVDLQTFDLQTNAGVVPITDLGNNFVSTNVEDALAELADAISPRWSFGDLQNEVNQTRLVDGALLSIIMRHDTFNNVAFGNDALNVIPGGTDAATALGYLAGGNLASDGSSGTYVGCASGLASSSITGTYLGSYAGASHIGNTPTFVGHQAGRNSDGILITCVGALAGLGAVGDYQAFFGYNSGRDFSGYAPAGIGYHALANMVGVNDRITGVGTAAFQFADTLYQTSGVGYSVGQNLKNATYVSAFGDYSMSWSSEVNRVIAVGYAAGEATSVDDSVFVGFETGVGWFGDGATLVGNDISGGIIAPVAVTLTVPNIVNYAGHGVPVGEMRAYRLTAVTYPGGITAAPQTVVARALTAGTLQLVVPSAFTTPGVGVQLALYNGQFTNAGGFGRQAIPTADNQIRLGNASLTEVRTAGAYFGSAFNVVSDKRLKTDFSVIPDDAAIAFSKLVNFTTFMRIKNVEDIQCNIEASLTKLRDELEAAKNPAEKSTTDNGETIAPRRVRSVGDIQNDLSKLEKEYNEVSKPENLLFGYRQAGVIAQEIIELADTIGFGHFLVHEDSGYYTVDFNSLLAVVARGFQLRLEKAGI